jgi:hypothetical protein
MKVRIRLFAQVGRRRPDFVFLIRTKTENGRNAFGGGGTVYVRAQTCAVAQRNLDIGLHEHLVDGL